VRFSHQREIVRQKVFSTNSHPTADWIYNEVRKSLPNISLGTVYRNLKQLTEEGIIRIMFDGAVAKYDWNRDAHHHLKCTICGSLTDIQLANDDLKKIAKEKFDFKVTQVEITFIGKCNKHKSGV